jgi:hypothetical protein
MDGVCHQLSNQILFATKTDSKAPLTVKDARGYWYSNFRYGTYGAAKAEREFFARVKQYSSKEE